MINNGEKLVFIAHPLRGNGTKEEFDYNIEMYKRLSKYYMQELDAGRGYKVPVSTAIYFASFLDNSIHEEREIGIKGGHRFLKLCDEIDVYRQNGISSGMVRDIEIAEQLGIKINYYDKYPWEETTPSPTAA